MLYFFARRALPPAAVAALGTPCLHIISQVFPSPSLPDAHVCFKVPARRDAGVVDANSARNGIHSTIGVH
jgi:hypothetical protein